MEIFNLSKNRLYLYDENVENGKILKKEKRGNWWMNKRDVIARRILGWKLNRWDRWFDFEKGTFIHESEFIPEQNLEHSMLIVERLEHLGYLYRKRGYRKMFS